MGWVEVVYLGVLDLGNYTCHTDCTHTHTPNQTHKSTNVWKKIEYQIPAVKLQRILLYKETPAYRAPNISIVGCYLTTFVSCCRPNEVASFSLMLSFSLPLTHTWIIRKPKGLPFHPNSKSSSLRHQGNCVSPLPSAFAKFIQHIRYTRNKTRQKCLDKKKRQVHCTVSPPLRTRIHLTLFFCRIVLQTRAPPPPPPHPPPAANFKSDIRL